eukprot:4712067-Pleurochrysis_carterae.AAC.5
MSFWSCSIFSTDSDELLTRASTARACAGRRLRDAAVPRALYLCEGLGLSQGPSRARAAPHPRRTHASNRLPMRSHHAAPS